MGWTFFTTDKTPTETLRGEFGLDWWRRVVDSADTGEAVILVLSERADRIGEDDGMFGEDDDRMLSIYEPDPDGSYRFLLVVKYERRGSRFGYKEMVEWMGPCGCEAPMSLVQRASPLKPGPLPGEIEKAREWASGYRARCAARESATAT